MLEMIKKWRRPLLFTLGGAIIGLIYHYTVGCSGGSCAISSSPVNSMAYMGFVGWLLSGSACCCGGGCRR